MFDCDCVCLIVIDVAGWCWLLVDVACVLIAGVCLCPDGCVYLECVCVCLFVACFVIDVACCGVLFETVCCF